MRKLLADRLSSRPRRRAAQPRFRGQLEPLETRTVLSATIGVMAVDFEANTVTVAIFQSYSPAPTWPAPVFFGSAVREAVGSVGDMGGARDALHFAEDRHSINVTSGRDFESRPPGSRPGVDESGKIYANAESNEAPAPVSLNAAAGAFTDNFAPTFRPPRLVQTLTSSVGSFTPLPSSSSSTSAVSTNLSSKLNVGANQIAFEAYSTDKLLLTTSDLREGDLDRELGDDADSPNKWEDAKKDADDSFVAEQTAAALDALQRERMAIDAVLGELRDVNPKENDEQPKTAAERQDHTADSRHATKDFVPAEERTVYLQESIPTDGGMVLLQPAGDPNSSAYDLTDVYFSRLGGDDQAPLAVEASLGMFQAIDVGAQPATNRASLPVAQPTQTGNPSVSAENAPAKKSEQPS